MKISRIEFENFRNFKEHGVINCSTDGKITVIYGKNGDGKTTLHQLLQWIFYDEVNFNKTASNHLYNNEFERDAALYSDFKVYGSVDFTHSDENYSLSRTYRYRKDVDEATLIGQECILTKEGKDHDWKRVEGNPQEIIDRLLPPGLKEYFFFDGESMIADLKVKSNVSANSLKQALYTMFDLDVIDAAIAHLGKTDTKTTMLGKLFFSRVASDPNELAKVKADIERFSSKLDKINGSLEENTKKYDDNHSMILDIVGQIGGTKSHDQYLADREEAKTERDRCFERAKEKKQEFGEKVFDKYPQMLIGNVMDKTYEQIKRRSENTDFPEGLRKELIHYLTEHSSTCICGREIGAQEREVLKEYLKRMPPNSYESMLSEFSNNMKRWSKQYDPDELSKYISAVYQSLDLANQYDEKMAMLDDEARNSPDIEELVVKQKKLEAENEELKRKIDDDKVEQVKYDALVTGKVKRFEALTNGNAVNKTIDAKIAVLKAVQEAFEKELQDYSHEYSKKLEGNIQSLLNQMLTTTRTVKVTDDFAVTVMDEYHDESKSEGQFAVVSFSYIGGILKMLQSEPNLKNKEYPLVLDGPFSKLDVDQKDNVVNAIPDFAPQVILFSKDNLQDAIPSQYLGKVWTIKSNKGKNVAQVKEGFRW